MENKKMTTLRKLIHTGVVKALEQEHLLQNQLESLVEHILDHSSIIYTEDGSLTLMYGNSLGIGNSNKDRLITLPKYTIFEFKKANHLTGTSHKWRLYTVPTFSELEQQIMYNADESAIVMIDGEIVGFKVEKEDANGNSFFVSGYHTIWGLDVYRLTYSMDSEQIEETLECKKKMEFRILQLLKDGATGIIAYNILDDIRLPFAVSSGIVYTSVENTKTANIPSLVSQEPRIYWEVQVDEEDDAPDWPILTCSADWDEDNF